MFEWPTRGALRTLALALAMILSSALMAWAIASATDSARSAARTSAQVAAEQARDATQHALQQTELALQQQQARTAAALYAECRIRDALIVQIDQTHTVLHRVLVQASALTSLELRRARKVPSWIRRVQSHLANDYQLDAAQILAPAQTDCVQLLAHPQTYQQPPPIVIP